MVSKTASHHTHIEKSHFGRLVNGEIADIFTLSNSLGTKISITNYGGIIVSLNTLDNQGNLADIVLGYDNIGDYENDPYYFGAIIGRFAGRIANGQLTIDKQQYQLLLNQDNSQLHGGSRALNKQLWQAKIEKKTEKVSLILHHISPDGDNGFPGNVNFKVIYSLDIKNQFCVEYFANTDKTTIINLTQHSYFNLAGHNNADISQHLLKLNAQHFLPMNNDIYPTGEIKNVSGTVHDFTQLARIGQHLNSNDEQICISKGFDNYWLLDNKSDGRPQLAAQVIDSKTGRRLTLYSDLPCIVFYSANYLDDKAVGKQQQQYQKHGAFCLEPQQVVNQKNGYHINNTLLQPESPFYSKTTYVFDSVDIEK